MGNKDVVTTQRAWWNISAALLAAILVAVVAGSQAFAQTNKSTNVLKLSPVRSDISVKPGETKTVTTTVTNLTKDPIIVRAVQNDFISGDERGTPALILDDKKFAPTHSLKRFMKPVADVTIPARQAKSIDVVISVPKDAQAGGYFGAIRFAPTSPDSGGQVNLSASAASLILLTVPGEAVEKLALTHFDILQNGQAAANFSTPDNIQTTFRFENKGSVQQAPFGKISVLQGDKVVYETDFNNKTPRDVILPDSARRWEVPLQNIGNFGHFTVQATFTYGQKNQTIEVSKSFWVIPQTLIIVVIAGILILIALIIGIWLFLRHYKRRILRHHGHHRR